MDVYVVDSLEKTNKSFSKVKGEWRLYKVNRLWPIIKSCDKRPQLLIRNHLVAVSLLTSSKYTSDEGAPLLTDHILVTFRLVTLVVTNAFTAGMPSLP